MQEKYEVNLKGKDNNLDIIEPIQASVFITCDSNLDWLIYKVRSII